MLTGILWELVIGALGMPSEWMASLTRELERILSICTTPLYFDWARSLMTTFQGVAIGVVLFVTLLRGVLSGILLEGGSEDQSVGAYLFQSLVPVALIAACPAITSAITTATSAFLTSFASADAFAGTVVGAWSRLYESCMETSGDYGVTALFAAVMAIVGIYYLVCIGMQCLKRWVLLTVLSIIYPITAIVMALGDEGDVMGVVKSMFYTGIITLLQVVALASTAGLADVGMALTSSPIGGMFMLVAGLSAVKQIPDWIEKYTAASNVAGAGGHASRMIMPVRTAVTSISRTGAPAPVAAPAKAVGA